MVNQGAILVSKIAVKLKGLSEFVYSLDGFLTGFTVTATGDKYIYLVEDDVIKSNLEMFQQHISKGYYTEDSFLEYRKTKNLSKLSKEYEPFISAEIGDIINVKKIKLSSPFNVEEFGYWEYYSLTYEGHSLVDKLGQIIKPVPYNPESLDMGLNNIAKKFYEENIHHNSNAITNEEKYQRALLIAKTAIYIHNINAKLFPLFNNAQLNENELNDLKTEQNNYWKTDVFKNPSLSDIQVYFNSVYNFFRAGYINQKRIKEAKGYEKVYWLALCLSTKALKIFTALNKIALLSWMQFNVRIGQHWLFFNDNESLVIKIIDSVTEEQADLFLDKLFEYSSTTYNNLFDRLADDKGFLQDNSIDDSTFGLGEDNRYKFIISLYLIWQASSYNPYQDGIFSQNNLEKFNYNKKLGTNPDPSNSFFDFYDSTKLNFEAQPISLNYYSTSSAGYYIDNFYFRSTNINGNLNHAHLDNLGTDLRDFTNLHEAPKNKVLAFQKEYRLNSKDGLYGTYNYLQAVSLINADISAAIKIPTVNGYDPNNTDVNNLIPIFVLKYIDDKNLESNVDTTIGYIADIAFLTIGGYSAITKLKYLNSLAGYTGPIMLGESASAEVLVSLFATAGMEALNVSAASVSLFLKIITNSNNADDEGFKKLKEFVTWIEIFSGVGSVISEFRLRKNAKNLVSYYNDNNKWPIEFTNDTRGIKARENLESIAGIAFDVSITKEYEALNLALIDRIKETGGGFNPKHYKLYFNETNTESLIGKALELKIYHRKLVEDFIYMSCRTSKIYTYEETLTLINYYAKVTLVKGFPTGFRSFNDYKLFCNQQKVYLDNYCKAMGINPFEYKIQGSVLYKSHPENPIDLTNTPVLMKDGAINTPGDLDQIIYLTRSDGERYVAKVREYWSNHNKKLKQADYSADEWKNIQKTDNQIEKAFQDGIIHKFRIIPNGNVDFLTGLKNAGKRNDGTQIFFPLNEHGETEIGASIIIKGSKFDILPTMPYKY